MLNPDWRPSTKVCCSFLQRTMKRYATWWLTSRGQDVYTFAINTTRKPHTGIFVCNLTSLLLFPRLLQGDDVWKIQFYECREPGDCVWSDAHAASGAERLDNAEWHEAAEIGGAAHDRAWGRLILKDWGLTTQTKDTYLFCQWGLSRHLESNDFLEFGVNLNLKKRLSGMTVWVEVSLVLMLRL